MTRPSTRLIVLAGIVVALAAVAAWRLTTAGGSEDPDEAAARIDNLEAAGDVRGLAREVANPNVKIARMAVLALGRIGSRAAPEIQKAIKDPRPEVRQAAAVALGQAGGEEQAKTLAAVATDDDEKPMVRASAVRALGHMRAYTQMDVLLRALEDGDQAVRRRANAAIENILGAGAGYKASDRPARRQRAIAELRAMWTSMKDKTEAFYNKN